MSHPVYFQDVSEELTPVLSYFHGRVLNMGCGDLDLGPRILGGTRAESLVNADIASTLPGNVRCDIHAAPFPDASFDTVLCNAVLEHVKNPFKAVEEFDRLLRPGGTMILCVPFLQPYHPVPRDYYRFTHEGIKNLMPSNYRLLQILPMHTIWQTLSWIVWEYVKEKRSLPLKIFFWPLIWAITRLRYKSDIEHVSGAACFQVVFTKIAPGPGHFTI